MIFTLSSQFRVNLLTFPLKRTQGSNLKLVANSGVPRNFVGGGVQQIQLRREDREKGDVGAVAP